MVKHLSVHISHSLQCQLSSTWFACLLGDRPNELKDAAVHKTSGCCALPAGFTQGYCIPQPLSETVMMLASSETPAATSCARLLMSCAMTAFCIMLWHSKLQVEKQYFVVEMHSQQSVGSGICANTEHQSRWRRRRDWWSHAILLMILSTSIFITAVMLEHMQHNSCDGFLPVVGAHPLQGLIVAHEQWWYFRISTGNAIHGIFIESLQIKL